MSLKYLPRTVEDLTECIYKRKDLKILWFITPSDQKIAILDKVQQLIFDIKCYTHLDDGA